MDLNYATAVVIQPNEKIVVTGSIGGDPARCTDKNKLTRQIGIACLNANGSFDPLFGVGGKMRFSYRANNNDFPDAMVLQNANILISGNSNYGEFAAVARVTSDGYLDRNFGTAGTGIGIYSLCAHLNSSNAGVYALALQGDKPLIGSTCANPYFDSPSGDTYIARLQQTPEPPPIVLPPTDF